MLEGWYDVTVKQLDTRLTRITKKEHTAGRRNKMVVSNACAAALLATAVTGLVLLVRECTGITMSVTAAAILVLVAWLMTFIKLVVFDEWPLAKWLDCVQSMDIFKDDIFHDGQRTTKYRSWAFAKQSLAEFKRTNDRLSSFHQFIGASLLAKQFLTPDLNVLCASGLCMWFAAVVWISTGVRQRAMHSSHEAVNLALADLRGTYEIRTLMEPTEFWDPFDSWFARRAQLRVNQKRMVVNQSTPFLSQHP